MLHGNIYIVAIGIAVSLVVLFLRYNLKTTILLMIVSVLMPLVSIMGMQLHNTGINKFDSANVQVFLMLSIVSMMLLSYITLTYMRNEKQLRLFQNRVAINLNFLYLFIALGSLFVVINARYELLKGYVDKNIFFDMAVVIILVLHVLSLSSLEKTWHFAWYYHHRLAKLFFALLLVLLSVNMICYITMLTYYSMYSLFFRINMVVQFVVIPFILLGYFKFRIKNVHVNIPRNTVYSSFSLMLCGIAFVGIGGAVFIFDLLKIHMQWFDTTLIVFSISFLMFLLISSGNVRIRIIHFLNDTFYGSQYDFWDQFFRLHQAYLASTTLNNSVINLIENIKYAVTATDAFVFLKDPILNNFKLKCNPEFSTAENLTISANSLIVKSLSSPEAEYFSFKESDCDEKGKQILASLDKSVAKLSPTYVFPIKSQNKIVGILMIVIKLKNLDKEDRTLINVFTQAIGYAYDKHFKMQRDVEQGQIQSFNQVVSFILHDLKNEIATLSLLAKNADVYIGNNEFQKSMIQSIRICSGNLTMLTERLSKSRRGFTFTICENDILSILESVTDSSILSQQKEIAVQWELKESCRAQCDAAALELVFHNLIKNSIESMSGIGMIKLQCSSLNRNASYLARKFNLSPSQLKHYTAAAVIEDSGCGMSPDFVETKLFKPFESTKDNGIGIGMYQCKTYVEKMNGLLLCRSEVNKGTAFCVVL